MTWEQLCKDKRFEDAPYKIESNAQGQIIMSPTSNYHGSYGFRVGELLRRHLPKGEVVVECAVETSDGTKEADVAWLSPKRWSQVAEDFSCKIAPEICVEVMSPSNTVKEMLYKKDLYLAAGALEYWLCDKEGRLRFFNASSELSKSKLAPKFPPSVKRAEK
jgi:Uma2 family endonuclease